MPVCPVTDACLEWVAPDHYTTGAPILPGTVLTYKVYRDGTIVSTTTNLKAQLNNEPRGTRCYTVTATVNGVESDESSPPKCKDIRFKGPTDGSIEAPTDGSIER